MHQLPWVFNYPTFILSCSNCLLLRDRFFEWLTLDTSTIWDEDLVFASTGKSLANCPVIRTRLTQPPWLNPLLLVVTLIKHFLIISFCVTEKSLIISLSLSLFTPTLSPLYPQEINPTLFHWFLYNLFKWNSSSTLLLLPPCCSWSAQLPPLPLLFKTGVKVLGVTVKSDAEIWE